MKTKNTMTQIFFVMLTVLGTASLLSRSDAQDLRTTQQTEHQAMTKADGRSALAAAGDERPMLRAESGGHIAKSARYATRFDGNGFEITGRKSNAAERGPMTRFQLLEMQQGTAVLAAGNDGAPLVQADSKQVRYVRRSGIVERYDVGERGVEQSFVLPRRVKSEGDLVITGLLLTDQPMGDVLPDGAGGVIIPFANEGWKLHYGAVTAIDARGAQQPGSLTVNGNQVMITVDGDWLARAAYPVVVDPLIQIAQDTVNESRPAVAFDPGWKGFETRPPLYFVAYESIVAGNKKIMGRLLNKDGVLVAGPFNISGDTTVSDSNPAVTFKYGSELSKPLQNFLVTWQRSDGWVAYRLYDRNGNPVTPATKLARGKDPDTSASPKGGNCRSTYGCEPYLIAYRFTEAATAASAGIALASINPTDGAVLSKGTVETFDTFVDDPVYAPHIAYGHSAAENWNYHVLTYRRPSGQIIARKVSVSGVARSPLEVSASSTGAPVVAFSYGGTQWAIVWRQQTYNTREGRYYVRLRSQLYTSNAEADLLLPNGTGATVVAVGGTTDTAVLPDYAVAGSQTKPASGLAFFQVSYVQGATTAPRGYRVYAQPVRTDNTLGSLFAVSNPPYTVDNTAVKFAHVKIDIAAPPIPSDCDGSATGKRCALWVWEYHYKATDHDIYGYANLNEY